MKSRTTTIKLNIFFQYFSILIMTISRGILVPIYLKLSDISYSVYVNHWLIMIILTYTLGLYVLPGLVEDVFLMLCITLIMALVYAYIEIPAYALATKRINPNAK